MRRSRAPWFRFRFPAPMAAFAIAAIAAIAAMAAAACGQTRAPSHAGASTATATNTSPASSTADGLSAALVNPNASAIALVGATIMTGTDEVIANGTLIMEGGRITHLGGPEMPIPATAKRVDVTGAVLTPGLIDAHSHLGVYPAPSTAATEDGNEMTAPATPEVRARNGYWPQDPQIGRALRGGVTAALILPGSANLVGGEGFTVIMKEGRTTSEVAFPGAPRTIKMACGENPKRYYGEKSGPGSRMGEIAAFRRLFADAKAYRAKRARHAESDESDGDDFTPDQGMQTLADLIDGKLLLQIHCYKANDMSEMMEITQEAGITIRAFHHALEAYKIRDLLAARGIAVATWADWWGFKLEAFDGIPQNAPLIHAAGGRAIIHSDSAELIQRLNQEAGKAMFAAQREGINVDDTDALRWITANPAWVLGIDSVTGTLQPGKRADVVVWNRNPFSVYAQTRLVYIAGELAYDAAKGVPVSDYEAGRTPQTMERP